MAAHPLKQGRVKLQFPWLDDAYESDWTRTVQLGGEGRWRGVPVRRQRRRAPVAFDRGALDHPFVIGGLYNGKDKPTVVSDVPLHDGLKKQAIRHTLSDRKQVLAYLLSQQTGARKKGADRLRQRQADHQSRSYEDRDDRRRTARGSVTIRYRWCPPRPAPISP